MSQTETVSLPPVGDAEIVGRFPCTQTQLRFWIVDQLEPGNPALNVAVRWEIRGQFEAATLEAAFQKVIDRHEILRTRFIEKEGKPVQEVVSKVDFKMSVIDLRNVQSGLRAERVDRIAEETAAIPFDLSTAGLFRAVLLMLENDRAVLLITAHHCCFDGWSIRVLGREVGEIAAAMDAGRKPNLPTLPLQYGDFALWQSAYMDGYGFEIEEAFWLEELKDAAYFEVASDHPRNAEKSNAGHIISIAKPLTFGERLDATARAHCVSQYSFGVAVMSAFLHRYTGEKAVMFGSQIAGRDDTDLENLIGVFINNLVMRFEVEDAHSFEEHLGSASRSVEAAINHRKMPFNKLVELINPPRDATRNPLVSVNYSLQKAFMEDHAYGRFEVVSHPSQSPGAIYDLNFIMISRPDGWRMSLEYNSALFDEQTAKRILQAWDDTFEWALDNIDAPLADMPVQMHSATPISSLEPREVDLSVNAEPSEVPEQQTQTIQMFGQIWADVLNVPDVLPDDNFFDLGGHSLLALRMISRVREKTGTMPGLAVLFRAPTLREFCAAIIADAKTDHVPVPESGNAWDVITFRKTLDRKTVITFNHPFLYHQLADKLPDDFSVYNLNLFAADLDGVLQKKSFEEMSADAVSIIKDLSADGEIALVGLCINGMLALEIARQLKEQGRIVRFVGMIDSWEPHYFKTLPLATRLWARIKNRFRRAIYFTGQLVRNEITLINFLKRFSITVSLMAWLRIKAGEETEEDIKNRDVTDLLVGAASRHTPILALDRSVFMFLSQSSSTISKRCHFGWQAKPEDKNPLMVLDGWHEDSLASDGIDAVGKLIQARMD